MNNMILHTFKQTKFISHLISQPCEFCWRTVKFKNNFIGIYERDKVEVFL
jgi:hypothetical protein